MLVIPTELALLYDTLLARQGIPVVSGRPEIYSVRLRLWRKMGFTAAGRPAPA
jgi:hypothetical protein